MRALASKTLAVPVLALLLNACATQPGNSSRSLPEVLNYARQHADYRETGVADCQAAISDKPNSFPFKPFFAGLLDVPEKKGGEAFCAALIEAVIFGDFTRREQDAFSKPSKARGKAPLGDLMRDLVMANERLRSQQVEGLPQAQACNCGQ